MNKFLPALTGLMFLGAASAFAQANKTVFDVQNVPAANLAACDDRPPLVDSTVRVRGIVISPGVERASSGTTRQTWIRDIADGGGFHNVTIFAGDITTPDDVRGLVPGDTVEIIGKVVEFNGSAGDGETEIEPITDGVTVIGVSPGPAPTANLLANVGVLNNNQRINVLPTGEQWEGAFVEIQNVTVVTVSPFTSGEARVSFTVADAAGNRIEISDRFKAGRLSQGFVAPNVGDVFTSIKGIIIHSKNDCPGSTGRGYTLNPFASSHYVKGATAPTVTALSRAIVSPCSTDVVTITANITDDGSVASAKLLYSVGASNPSYTEVDMTNTGSAYSGNIPAQAEGTLVKYYIKATDNNNQVTNLPNVPNNTDPVFYTVRCGAPQIRDVQYTPFTSGRSGYTGLTVSGIEGIVTADASNDNLGQVYIQQANELAWAGLWITGGSIATLRIGDLVRVSGIVEEDFNVTRLNVGSGSVTLVSQNNTITPLTVDPATVSTYSFALNEPLEGMLIRVQNPASGQPLTVVDQNTASGTSNFGEWRLGPDPLDPSQGVVIHTGNRTSTNYSSLSVKYINDLRWRRFVIPDSNAAVVVNVGDKFSSATGILYYGFSLLKLLPRTNADLPDYVAGVKRGIGNSPYVSIRPNPAGRHATVNVTAADLKGAAFKVTSVIGGTVNISGCISGENTRLDLSTLAPGLYNLVITGSKGTVTEKLVVE